MSGKELDNCLRDQLINFAMAGDLGRHISPAVFINIMVCAMTHENGSPLNYFLEQFPSFHAGTLILKTPDFRFCASLFSSSCRIW
jgi:hypothetical protein